MQHICIPIHAYIPNYLFFSRNFTFSFRYIVCREFGAILRKSLEIYKVFVLWEKCGLFSDILGGNFFSRPLGRFSRSGICVEKLNGEFDRVRFTYLSLTASTASRRWPVREGTLPPSGFNSLNPRSSV